MILYDLLCKLPSRHRYHPAFTIHSVVVTGHPPSPTSSVESQNHYNRSFRYAAPHLWNKLPPSLRVPCQSATSECSSSSPGSDSAPKSVVGVSHRVFHSRLKTHLFSRSFPPQPSSLSNGLISRFLSSTRVWKSLALKTLVSAAD